MCFPMLSLAAFAAVVVPPAPALSAITMFETSCAECVTHTYLFDLCLPEPSHAREKEEEVEEDEDEDEDDDDGDGDGDYEGDDDEQPPLVNLCTCYMFCDWFFCFYSRRDGPHHELARATRCQRQMRR